MPKNAISLPGVSNTRDLGGYSAGNGFIRKGVLIRSGTLAHALPEAVQILKDEYSLQTVVDFRMKSRTKSDPDPVIPGAKYVALSVVEMLDYAASLGSPIKAARLLSKRSSKEAVLEMAFEYGLLGPEMYVLFLLGERGKKAYRSFFEILLKNDPDRGAVLWHCDDGKDRAGLATMLLLSALGTDRETILKDYLLTNESNAKRIEDIKKDYEELGVSQDKLKAMIFASGGVFAEYMNHAMDTLRGKYGSVTGYLKEGLGLKESDFSLLREKYLEKRH